MRGTQLARRAYDNEQILDQLGAFRTMSEMSLLFRAATVFISYQTLLQLNASHTALPKPLLRQCNATSLKSCSRNLRWPPLFAGWPATYLVACSTRSGFLCFFKSLHLKQISQLHSRLMQLGLAVADRASRDFRDFIMLVSLNIMQHKDQTIARRQIGNGALQRQTVDSRITMNEATSYRALLSQSVRNAVPWPLSCQRESEVEA